MADTNMVEQQNTALTNEDTWGAGGARKSDILIPRLVLMQDGTKSVKARVHTSGQIIDSVSGAPLAEPGSVVEFIPFMTFSEYHIFEKDDRGSDDKLKEKILITNKNECLPKEDVVHGKPIERVRAINFFCMLPDKLDELPYLITFKKSGYSVGRQLSTHFQISAMKVQPPAVQKFLLGSEDQTWDSHDYKRYTLKPGAMSSEVELAAAKKWYQILKINEAKVDAEYEDEFNTEEME